MNDLAQVLRAGLARNPDGVAVREAGAEISYRELGALAERLAHALADLGVRRGDRVAIWLPKSIRAVAAMQAVLRLGAAYVPIDPLSPPARVMTLLRDCEPAACVTLPGLAVDVLTGDLCDLPALLAAEDGGPHAWHAVSRDPRPPLPAVEPDPDRLAYILYTSGSTGTPKGVRISHRNALAFVDWATAELDPGPGDAFSSHAPFHFDLSVLDLYCALGAGARVCLIPEGAAYVARELVRFAHEEAITVWYSVPTALTLMAERGGLLDDPPPSLRAILFAGEPFPVKHLRRLREAFGPGVRLLNLYGPTETNVCTFHEVHDIAPTRTAPVPIGGACCGDRVWAETDDGGVAAVGERGELLVEGPTVMLGYHGRPPQRGPYRTGDVVERVGPDCYEYVGRRDAMVKVRGHRVELGDVEAALLAHPDVREAAVVVTGSGPDARLVGFVSLADGAELSLLEAKRHCSERLPRYMIVADLVELDELPRTRNGKVDRRSLAARLEEVLVT